MTAKFSLIIATIIAAFAISASAQAGEVSVSSAVKSGSQMNVASSSLTSQDLIAREGGCRRRCGA